MSDLVPTHTPGVVSVVIPLWNGDRYISACLQSLAEYTGLPYEIVVVDNGSVDTGPQRVRAFGEAHPSQDLKLISNPTNMGFASAINTGVAAAKGDFIILMNQDVVAQAGWLTAICACFAREPRTGIVGSKLLYPDGRVQHAGGYLLSPSWEGMHYTDDAPDHRIDFVTGAVMSIRRACWDAVGPFDEGFFPAYYEDVDFCLRARKRGWAIQYVAASVLTHHESTTRATGLRQVADFHIQRLRCVLKHQPFDWLWEVFLPAERERIDRSTVAEWRYGLADVFLRAALSLATLRPDLDPNQQRALITQLLQLRDMAYTIVSPAETPATSA